MLFRSGKVLWQFRLGTSALGYPITYSVGDKQYVAVPTGVGGITAIKVLTNPEIYVPPTGSALYVFELPDRP